MKDRLKILHLNTHDVAGGAAKVASRLALWQRSRGHRAGLLVGQKLDAQDVHSVAFDPLGNAGLQEQCEARGELFYHLQGSHLLGPAVAAHDVLHLHNLHGGYFNPFSLPLLAGIRPTLWTLHDMQGLTGHCAHSFECERWAEGCGACPHLDTEPAIRVDRTAASWREKREIYLRSPIHLAVPSQWLFDKIARSAMGHLPVHLIPNGLDTRVFSPRDRAEARRRFGLPKGAILIGTVAQGGVTNQWKGWSFSESALQQVLTKMPQAHFVSVGAEVDGGNRFHGIGHIEDEVELSWAYSALDLFLYTPRADNCPLVVLEALACGVPLATFDTGGVAELVRDGIDGLVVRQGDVGSLTECVLRLVEDDELRGVLARQARQGAVERFGLDLVASRYEAAYAGVCRQFEQHRVPTREELLAIAPEVVRTAEYLTGLQYLCDHAARIPAPVS